MKLIEKLRQKILKSNVIEAKHIRVTNDMIDKLTINSRFIDNLHSIEINANQINITNLRRN
jgi:hypothetical protein